MTKFLLTFASFILGLVCSYGQVSQTISVSQPGSLSTLIGDNKTKVTDLTLTGTINATDFTTIKQMTALKNLDMSQVKIDNNTIPAQAFQNRVLNSLVLPEGLETIGEKAFGASAFTAPLVLPSTVKTIINWAFQDMKSKVVLDKTKNSLEAIGVRVFQNYTGSSELDFSEFTSINLYWHVTNNGVFSGYAGHVTLPPTLATIPDYMFYDFRGTVSLPAGLKTIGEKSFASSNMASLVLPEGLETVGHFSFENSKIGADLVLPSTVKTIINWAFKDMKSKVIFDKTKNSLEVIGVRVFQNYTGSSELDFSEFTSIKSYEYVTNNGVFSGYAGHVTLPPTLATIPDYMFYDFRGTVSLPAGLKTIGEKSFASSNMPSLVLPEGLETVGHFSFENSKIGADLVLPSTVKTIINWAFKDMKSKVILDKTKNSLESIGLRVFQNYTGSSELDFSEFTSIKSYNSYTTNHGVFSGYSGHVILASVLESIPNYMFYDFRGTVLLSPILKSIGNNAFQQSTIKQIELPATVTTI